MTRKLPVYIMVDTSGSMSGEPIQSVNNGVKMLIRSLRKNPQALETVKLGFIEYNSTAKETETLKDLPQVKEPVFTASGGTCLGAGLDLLATCLKRDVVTGDTKNEVKGDWKPLVFHLTDGYPNDNWEDALARFDRKSVNFILSCGVPGSDRSVLEKVSGGTDKVLELESATEAELSEYFEWVTASITMATNSVATAENDEVITPGSLPPFKPTVTANEELF